MKFVTTADATCIDAIVSQYKKFASFNSAGIDECHIRQFLIMSLPMASHIADDNESDYVVCTWEVTYVYRKNEVTATVTVAWNPVHGACVCRVQCKYMGPKASLFEILDGKERRLMKIDESGVIMPHRNRKRQSK